MTKPADLLVGDPPTYESGKPDGSIEQRRLESIVEENDLNQRIHEIGIGAGYRGDSWLKVFYGARMDVSETPEGFNPPKVPLEPILEAVPSENVFPEVARNSRKRFNAVNIAWVEHVKDENGREKAAYLNVERHVPGFILYKKFVVEDQGVEGIDVQIPTYSIVEEVATGREFDVEETGVPHLLVHHIPYKTTDDSWRGESGIEKIETLLAAINDRLAQIDYVITKHSDPPMYGPSLDENGGTVTPGGMYVAVEKDDVPPGYVTWEAQLDAAFKELYMLLGLVYQISETPQWVFGTTVAGDNSGGTGTSHTDAGAIKARFFPLLSKVKRIRTHVEKAIRDALYSAMLLENHANRDNPEWERYDAPYPKIRWKDGIPRDEKYEAELWDVRTGGKPTADVRTAIKAMDGLDDMQAQEMVGRIEADEERTNGTVDPSVFNTPDDGVA